MRFLLMIAAPLAISINSDQVVQPNIVSTSAAEVRIAYSPDGRHILWGAIGRDAAEQQQDIWEIHRTTLGWSKPARVTFDTDAEEFDPAFSADGRRLYFQSNRPGGLGGSDLYVVRIDPTSGEFGLPENLGPNVNSKGDEWAATPTRDGKLVFSSNGWGGRGKHDLMSVDLRRHGVAPTDLGAAINGPQDELDPALSPDGKVLIFSSGDMDAADPDVKLFVSHLTRRGWSQRHPLGVGCSSFVLGASISPLHPRQLSYAANCPGGLGRMDIHQTVLPSGI